MRWSNEGLAERYRKHVAEGKTGPCIVFENINIIGRFVSELKFRSFPFDSQQLRVTIMAPPIHQVLFTHRVVMDKDTKQPKLGVNGRPIRTCKANLETDFLAEYSILGPGQRALKESEVGKTQVAVSKYAFIEHDRAFSAEGVTYQRLDFYVFIAREAKSVFANIMLPSLLISLACFSVFSLDIVDHAEGRFSTLTTFVLTLVANNFVVSSRLPKLAYWTFTDLVLFSQMIFVYLLILETSVIVAIADAANIAPQLADQYASYFFGALFVLMNFTFVLQALRMVGRRYGKMIEFEKEADASFDDEEWRVAQIFKREAPARTSRYSVVGRLQRKAESAASSSTNNNNNNGAANATVAVATDAKP